MPLNLRPMRRHHMRFDGREAVKGSQYRFFPELALWRLE